MSSYRDILTAWSTSSSRHCLDLRPTESYQTRHLTPSTSIPLSTLHQRFGHLPPRSAKTPLLLILAEPGLFNNVPVPTALRDRGWIITDSLTDSDELWQVARHLGILGSGTEGTEILFVASGILARNIDLVERSVTGGRALDIGCGSGRDLGFLATREFIWGLNGVDNWHGAITRTKDLIASLNPSRMKTIRYAQVDKFGQVTPPVKGTFDLILLVRFFPSELLRRVHELVRPGGFLLFSHFTEREGVQYEAPPAEKRVRPGQVEALLSRGSGSWTVLDRRYSESEDGRPLWDVVARYQPES